MSKCGLCGVDFGSESHMVLKCKATITDELKDRINGIRSSRDYNTI